MQWAALKSWNYSSKQNYFNKTYFIFGATCGDNSLRVCEFVFMNLIWMTLQITLAFKQYWQRNNSNVIINKLLTYWKCGTSSLHIRTVLRYNELNIWNSTVSLPRIFDFKGIFREIANKSTNTNQILSTGKLCERSMKCQRIFVLLRQFWRSFVKFSRWVQPVPNGCNRAVRDWPTGNHSHFRHRWAQWHVPE